MKSTYDTDTAAHILGISRRTVERYLANGRLPDLSRQSVIAELGRHQPTISLAAHREAITGQTQQISAFAVAMHQIAETARNGASSGNEGAMYMALARIAALANTAKAPSDC